MDMVTLEQLTAAVDSDNLKEQQSLCELLNWHPTVSSAGSDESAGTDGAADSSHESSSNLCVLIDKFGPASLTCKDEDGNTLVHQTALNCEDEADMELIHKALGPECFTSEKGEEQKTAIHFAARNPCNTALKWLVKLLGPSCLELKDEDGHTPLHFAAIEQGSESMELFKAELGTTCFHELDDQSRLPIHWAAMNETSNEAFKWMLDEFGAEFLTVRDSLGNTPAHLAAWIQGKDSMELLKEQLGNDLFTLEGQEYETIIHSAAQNTISIAALQWCIEELGTECLMTKDPLERTPIHLVAQYLSEEDMKMVVNLLGQSCLAVQCERYRTAVHYAAMNEQSNATLRWIVSQLGPECLTKRDDSGSMAVHLAAEYQNVDSLIYIFETLGDPAFKLPGINKRIMAHYAAQNNNNKKEMIAWLVNEIGPLCLVMSDIFGISAAHIAGYYDDHKHGF